MGQHLLATVPSLVVGVAFLWILYSLLRGEIGDKREHRDRREGRRDGRAEERGEDS